MVTKLGATTPQPIRIARIIDRLNIGGPAKHVVWLTSELNSDEYETTLITGTVPDGEGDMSYFARQAGVDPVIIREMSRELGPRDAVVIVRLLAQLWKLKPHIIHTHKSKAGATGRIAALIYKWMTPTSLWLRPRECYIVHTFHGHVFHGYFGRAKSRLFIGVEKALARVCTDRIVVISDQQRMEILGRFGVGRKEQFAVIPLGIDLEEVNTQVSLRKDFGIAADEIIIGAVGRLCEVKNYALLVRAAARLMQNDVAARKLRLVIVGDGHLRSEIASLASELRISERVIFTGFRDDAEALYQEFDFVALTSFNEGTPLSLIEAMSKGLAVAATEVGGVVDIMGARQGTGQTSAANESNRFTIWEHGVTAVSGDVEGFSSAMRFLIERPELRTEMGERGSAFVHARLSKQRLVRDIKQLYCGLLGIRTKQPTPVTERVVSS
jgi:glycosyltransferase involved in cell wall biosynthesis